MDERAEGTTPTRWKGLSVSMMVVVHFYFLLILQRFKYIYWSADLFTHCWRQRQRRQQRKNWLKILRQSKPAAKPCEECNAAAKLCLCCEECTPLPEFASSRRTHPPSGPRFDSRSGAFWLLVTHSSSSATMVFSNCSVLLSVLSVGGLQAELFCLNVIRVAQTRKRSYKLSDQSGVSTLDIVFVFFFSFLQIDCCSYKTTCFVIQHVLDFQCFTLFCTVSERHMNPGFCVLIMHSRLLRTYYPMGIYKMENIKVYSNMKS